MNNKLPPNPTPQQRRELLKDALIEVGRLEDYDNILRLMEAPKDILHIVPPGRLKGKRIGIIGGGLAGLSSGFELRKTGADITIFEPIEERVGGRVYTYYFDQQKKYYGEFGALRIPISHETTWHYINLFKLRTSPFVQSNPNTFIYVHNTRIRDTPGAIEEKLYPLFFLTPKERNTPWSELYQYAITYGLNMLKPAIRTQILRTLPYYNPVYASMININIRQNFELLNLSQDAINLISSIDPLIGAMSYLSYNELLQDFYPLDYSILYGINGGNVKLPMAFYQSLISPNPKEYKGVSKKVLGKVAWKSGTWVTGIYERNKNKVAIRYKKKDIKEEFIEEFDYVVCTVPYSILRAFEIYPLFSNIKMEAIREINYINCEKTLFFCKKRFWEENTSYGGINGGISTTDLPINEIIYPSDHYYDWDYYSSKEPGVITSSYSIGLDATRLGNMYPNLRFKTIKRQVEKVHGLWDGYLDDIVLDSKTITWNNEPWFRGCIALFNPGQKRIFSYEMLRPEYNNKVFFAGEHVSQNHGWMQGALFTGKLAANMLANAAIYYRA